MSCRWSNVPIDRRVLDGLRAALRRAGDDLHPVDRPWRVLFSRSGFDLELRDLARDPAERLHLVTPDDLYAAGLTMT
ncbi:MAG: hypothetical protein HY332_13595 [Chloroflexi bacterium]|nr:hypothetical protein [Chloroflexota bacterium]